MEEETVIDEDGVEKVGERVEKMLERVNRVRESNERGKVAWKWWRSVDEFKTDEVDKNSGGEENYGGKRGGGGEGREGVEGREERGEGVLEKKDGRRLKAETNLWQDEALKL
ncbi:hypothetical protein Pmani_006921 [Petrolisthes manimaculis]|uniref:Uncharacterized protein n=1 Tax=Petrolisthes manimaculis TaxID=1843537 RepID=A0AAE1UJ62_9EUCA|nr:hypothetical protein Pmani_006921 [Petrolisthes manimaculis]